MLLFLHDNIFDIDFATNDVANHSIENLLAAGVDGNHLILAELPTLKRLVALDVLSNRSKAYLRRMINSFSEIGSLIRTVEFFYIIEGALVEPYMESGTGQWHVPLLSFSRIESVVKTTLLSENLTDCQIYQHAANHFRLLNGLGHLRVSITPHGGGGSTTSDEVRRRVFGTPGICLCIIDSDRLSPHSSLGNTAKSCEDVMIASQKWWFELLVTSKRELENEVPNRFIESALSSNGEFQKILDNYLLQMESLRVIEREVINYLDFKGGLSLHWILEQSAPVRDFWLNAIQRLKVKPHCTENCIQRSVCTEANDRLCQSNSLICGIADSLLAIVLQWLEKENPVAVVKMLSNENDSEWLALGKRVFYYGLSGHVIRV